MAENNLSLSSENGVPLNNTEVEGESFTLSRCSRDGQVLNMSNKMDSTHPVLSSKQEIFSKEISKVQELMVQQEQSFEAELEELVLVLAKMEEENDSMETKITELELQESDQSEEALERAEKENNDLVQVHSNLISKHREMLVVIDGYQRSIARFKSQYDADVQHLLEQKNILAEERDIALQHVNNMEAQFNSIHQKYEKCKNVIEQFRINEKKLAQLSQESSDKMRSMTVLFQTLKDHATEKLEKYNIELSEIVKNNRTEHAKLQAILQRMNLRCEGQEEMIQRKNNEMKETVTMCDRLIGKFQENGSLW